MSNRASARCEYVNPDAVAQDELGAWNDAATELRAAQLPTERRKSCLRLDAEVTLDALAEHAGTDKFHLCRAFRAQVAPTGFRTRRRGGCS